jgi:hypothetical protein
MIPKSGNRFPDKIMLQRKKEHDPEKWEPVSRLREAVTMPCQRA